MANPSTAERRRLRRLLRPTLIACLLAALLSGSGRAALPEIEILPAFPNLNFSFAAFLTGAGDGTDRIFVVERGGTIRVFPNDPDAESTKTFFTITGADGLECCGETGLLGLAFDPDYATNGYFYVNYTAKSSFCTGDDICTKIVRYEVSEADPDAADPTSGQLLLEYSQPFPNHNGGMLAFSPADGMLYIGSGDGGSGNDPQNNGQNKDSLLGKILRLDPQGEGSLIPPDNPFAQEGGAPEIWHYGLRNPWRFSFDRAAPHDMWIGDVGQNRWEEIDFAPAETSEINYGWKPCEATHDRGTTTPSETCEVGNGTYEAPVLEYPNVGDNSVTGGYVYRGRREPALRGYYVYAEYKTQVDGRIWAWDRTSIDEGTQLGIPEVIGSLRRITSFGEDEAGELYIISFDGAEIYVVPEPGSTSLLAAGVGTLALLLRGRRGRPRRR